MKYNKKGKVILIVILALTLSFTVGYALLNTVIKNRVLATLSPVKWQVYMDRVSFYKDTTSHSDINSVVLSNDADSCLEYDSTDETICTKSITLDANVSFNKVEKYVIIKFYVNNSGDMPAIIADDGIQVEGLGEFVTYSLKYSSDDSGIDVAPGDYLSNGASKPMFLKLTYFVSDNVSDDDLFTEDASYNITISIRYIRGSKSAFVDNSSAHAVVLKSNVGKSSEILTYTSAMSSSADSKLYLLESTEDEQYPIYFWRGTHDGTKNNFIFAGKCWLGIRTTDSGGIKIMYNGEPVDGKCTTTTGDSTVVGFGKYNSSTVNSKYKDGSINSNAKVAVDAWYENNLIQYQNYLEDTVFCNDLGDFWSSRRTDIPSLECSVANSFTVSDDYGNGELDYPVGIISADEAVFGGYNFNNGSVSFLYNVSGYWTMTQGRDSRYSVRIKDYYLDGESTMMGNGNVNDNYINSGYRPVVSLNSRVTFTGTGTMNDPFVVVTE